MFYFLVRVVWRVVRLPFLGNERTKERRKSDDIKSRMANVKCQINGSLSGNMALKRLLHRTRTGENLRNDV